MVKIWRGCKNSNNDAGRRYASFITLHYFVHLPGVITNNRPLDDSCQSIPPKRHSAPGAQWCMTIVHHQYSIVHPMHNGARPLCTTNLALCTRCMTIVNHQHSIVHPVRMTIVNHQYSIVHPVRMTIVNHQYSIVHPVPNGA